MSWSLAFLPFLYSLLPPNQDVESPAASGHTNSENDNARRERRAVAIVIAASVIYFAGLAYYAATRPIDGDEGFYATAARLVWQGKVPYRDFFYQQAPLLPYLYGWMWAAHPRSLVAMRLISAACGGAAVLLWGVGLVSLRRIPVHLALATFATVLLNPYWVSWNVVVKTYAFANLFMSIATICLYAALHTTRKRWYFVAGLTLAACTSVRSLYGPVLVVVLLWIFLRKRRTGKLINPLSLTFLGGSLCGLLPMIVSFVSDPHAFVFNNIQYHRLDAGYMWWQGRFVEGYRNAGHTAHVYFNALVIRLLGTHPYFAVSLILTVVGAWSLRKRRRSHDRSYSDEDYLYFRVALLMLATYALVALIPFPPYDQYFDAPLVAFFVPFMSEGLRVSWITRRKSAAVPLLLLGLSLFALEIRAETASQSFNSVWRLTDYREVSRLVRDNSDPNDVVLSFWPGYVFESGREYFPGLENHFVYRIINKVPSGERDRYHIVSPERVMDAISRRDEKLLVLSPWIGEYENSLSGDQLRAFRNAISDNYWLAGGTREIGVYRRRESGTR